MMPALIPAPRRLRPLGGAARLPAPVAIRIGMDAPLGALEAATRLRDALRARGIRAAVVATASAPAAGPGIHLGGFADPASWGIPAGTPSPAEAYGLRARHDTIRVEGRSVAGLRHGIATLLQLVRVEGRSLTTPSVAIADWPELRRRGVLLDISRWKVPSTRTIESIMDWMAGHKLNLLQLYSENNFAFRRYPTIGRGYGRLTGPEIRALDAFARSRGVELMPNFASFGHLERILERKEFRRLSVGASTRIINPLVPATYRFLGHLYDEYLPNFSSDTFNINCDETWDLGKGRSARIVKRLGAGEVYLRHVLKLHGIVTKRHRKRVMMWGDILSHHPTFIPRLPRDLIVLPWGYFNRWKERDVRAFRKAGLEYLICPGTSAWHTLSPWTHTAHVNITSAARTASDHGGSGIMTTDWGDGGHQHPFGWSMNGLAFAAEQSWTGGRSAVPEFSRRFGRLEFGDRTGAAAKLWKELGGANEALGIKPVYVSWWYTVNFGLLYYDHLETAGPVVLGVPFKHRNGDGDLFKRVTAAGVRRLAATVDRADRWLRILERQRPPASSGLDPLNRDLVLRELRYGVTQLDHLARQLDWRLKLRSGTPPRTLRKEGRRLIADLHGLRREFLQLWAARNRPPGKRVHLGLLRGTGRFYRALIAGVR